MKRIFNIISMLFSRKRRQDCVQNMATDFYQSSAIAWNQAAEKQVSLERREIATRLAYHHTRIAQDLGRYAQLIDDEQRVRLEAEEKEAYNDND